MTTSQLPVADALEIRESLHEGWADLSRRQLLWHCTRWTRASRAWTLSKTSILYAASVRVWTGVAMPYSGCA